MREILFRGKRLDNGGWKCGDLFHCPNGSVRINPHEIGQPWLGYDVDPSTVGQYTGLKDKNDKRIFEGDIITGWFNHEKIIGYIFYGGDATFFVQRDGLYGIGLNNASDWLKVIGNIYDNPELLKDGDVE